mmetsp:Transcript_40910/g.47030  ORF Transcript_40910/g.47030 Transcript_40910/m.47030 type:complete len:150 (+) Transcript_40910:68-517(+)
MDHQHYEAHSCIDSRNKRSGDNAKGRNHFKDKERVHGIKKKREEQRNTHFEEHYHNAKERRELEREKEWMDSLTAGKQRQLEVEKKRQQRIDRKHEEHKEEMEGLPEHKRQEIHRNNIEARNRAAQMHEEQKTNFLRSMQRQVNGNSTH